MSDLALPAEPRRTPAISNGARRRIGSRYVQALRTYNRPIPIAISTLVFVASLYPVFQTKSVLQYACAGGTCMTAAVIAMLAILNLRQQFDNPHSALIPGFRAPHLVAAAIILVAINFAAANSIFLLTGLSFTMFFVYSLFLTSVLSWMCYEPVGVVLVMVIIFNLVSPEAALPSMEHQHQPVDLKHRPLDTPVAFATLVIAIALLALLFSIYSRLKGETSSQSASSQPLTLGIRPRPHDGRINFPLGPITRLAGTFFLFLQSRLESLLRDRQDPITLSACSPFGARVAHRRRATFCGLYPDFFALILSITILLLFLAATWGNRTWDNPTPAADELALFLFFFPAGIWIFITGIFWPKQWLYLPAESLFPASRPRFIREFAAALAVDSLSFWTTSSSTAFLSSFLLFPRYCAQHVMFSIQCALTTALLFLFSYALITWTMLFRNAILSGLALGISIAVLLFSITILPTPNSPTPWTHPLTIALSLLTAALLLGAHAYHRWLRIDLN